MVWKKIKKVMVLFLLLTLIVASSNLASAESISDASKANATDEQLKRDVEAKY